jgi:MYXO-CTERM domain-containing protein
MNAGAAGTGQPPDTDGCGCRVPRSGSDSNLGWMLGSLIGVALVRRRARDSLRSGRAQTRG